MKISDIIRKFADHLDQQEGEQHPEQEIFCTTSAIGGIYINFINAQ
jgi:hypothetical protein